ncbi:MAG: DUF4335 domain-containing protein [Limnospira maxima]
MLVTRQYTPPTCTLEVSANTSFFSRWKHESWDNFRFKLSFDDPRLSEYKYIAIEGDRHNLTNLYESINRYINDFLTASPLSEIDPISEESPDAENSLTTCSDFQIKPDGLLYHDLFLGNLAPSPSESFVHLSALQLFDVAAALRNCITEIEPFLTSESQPKRTSPAWLRTLMIIITTTGLFSGIINLSNYYRRDRHLISTPETPQISTSTTPPEPPPLPEFPMDEPPAPPQIEIQVAPDLPLVDTVPLTIPPPLFDQPPPSPELIPNITTGAPETDGIIIIPTEPVNRTPVNGTVNRTETPPPPTPLAPPPTPLFDIGTVPENISLPPLQNARVPETDTPENYAVQDIPEDSENAEPIAQLTKREPRIVSIRSLNNTVFDEIPQVAEVRSYFVKNWHPHKNLNRILQYRLQLNSQGAIDSITPLGSASVNWLPQIKFPSANQPFVSPMEDGKTAKIRVVLDPSGRVQTFLESHD